MLCFKSVLSSVAIAALCASGSSAIFARDLRHIHHTVELRSGVTLQTCHPPSAYETYGTGIDHPLSKRSDVSSEDSAIAFVQTRNIAADSIHVGSSYASDITKHVYLKQKANGITFANAVANVALNKENKVVAYGRSFVNATTVASSAPSILVQDAIVTAQSQLQGTHDASRDPAPSLQYVVKDDGSVVLTHSFAVGNISAATYYQAYVDAHSGELVSVTDYVARASYYAVPLPKIDPTEGMGTVVNPQNYASSPYGWHSTDNVTTSNQTTGNNAYAGDNSGTLSVESSGGDVFDYVPDFTQEPTVYPNVDAARVNNFYIVNTIHDIHYQYGFTESAYNFQANNFGKGGEGNDPIQIIVQSDLGIDDSAFLALPDGQEGIMYMFLWNWSDPERDGALENDIPAHENTHGLTNRMTGGGTAACLQTTESGGLGEGWSDAFADWLLKNDSSVPDFVLGEYVINDYYPQGIRNYPYSTNSTTNPLTYSSLQTLTAVHDIGEVWANTLHNVYAALVGEYGWSNTSHTDATGSEGNVVHMHLFIDALAIQPCNPTFLDARAAWIQADQNRYGGAHTCTLWNAFASKGLGVNAANYTNDNTVPEDC